MWLHQGAKLGVSVTASFIQVVGPVQNPTDHDKVRAEVLVKEMAKHAVALGVYGRTRGGRREYLGGEPGTPR